MSQFAPEGAEIRLHPVTAKERAVWLLHQYLPDEGVLNVPFVVKPVAELDLATLQAAVTAMIRRHENLRTLFPAVDGEPRRLTLAADDPRAELEVRVKEVPPARLEEEASREVSASFDFATELPIRVTVLRSGGSDLVYVTVSHMVYDGASQSVLRTELEVAYGALLSDGQLPPALACPVPPPPLRDPDEEALAYWRAVLDGARPSPDLEIGLPRGRAADYPGVILRQRIRPTVWEAVKKVARRTSSPASAVVLAGFASVLRRHGAGDDILIGVPSYNRGFPPHQAIGYYTCVTPVRVRLDSNTDFDALVRQCARQLLEGLRYPGVSLDDVEPGAFEASAPGGRPLVRYMLNYLADMRAEPGFGTALSTCQPPRRMHSRMDIDLGVLMDPEGLLLRVVHADDIFSGEEMETLLGRLQALLTAAADGGSVSTLDMRTEADRAAADSVPVPELPQPPLLAEEIAVLAFADADDADDSDHPDHSDSDDPENSDPVNSDDGDSDPENSDDRDSDDEDNAVFVPVGAGTGIGGDELDASAAALVAELAQRGADAGELIGVLGGSLIDTVIGVLGCWAAGCAAVPLPRGSDAPAVAMTAATEPTGPGDIPIRRVTGPGCAAYLPAREDAALILAYGGNSVVLSHDALAEAAAALAAELPLDSRDLVAVGPSARSGPELLEVLLAMASGARVLPLSAADEAAARHALSEGASVLVTSPEVISGLLAKPGAQDWPEHVRVVLRGGRLLPGLASRARAAGMSLVRVTGPVGSSGVLLAGAVPDNAGPGLLGRMPPSRQLRLTNRSGAPALPLVWARLTDRDGTDVFGVPVRELADGWLEAMEDPLDNTGGEQAPDTAGSADAAEAFGVDFVELWRTVLDRPEVAAGDNFFAFGGDSLRAARLVAQVRKRTGVKMSLRAIFKAPTPISFAAAVRAAR